MTSRFVGGTREGRIVDYGIPVALSAETSTERTPAGFPAPRTLRRVARLRPKLGVMDVLLQLWRSKWLMLLVFVSVFLVGVIITLILPAKYAANTRLLVKSGQEYVFDTTAGDAARGGFLHQESVMHAETELARSPVIAERVISGMGLSRLYPDLAKAKLRARDRGVYVIDQEALEVFAGDLDVASAPRSSILRMTYSHEDPTLAAATLNRFVTEYLAYRQEVLFGEGDAGLSEQRDVIEGRLAEADKALRAFLVANGLSDFTAETAAARKQFGDISDELAKVQVSLRESGSPARANPNQSIRALTVRSAALTTQKREAEARMAVLSALEPDYMRLKRDRDALEAAADALAARNELAARNAGSISIYEAARPPARSDATNGLIAIGAAILGLVAGLIAGFMRAGSVTGFATAGSVERTLGLHVLATAKDRTR
ncbi:MAG: hypothetical protein EOP61_20455 [Sphingomonadales bacterium]|nr:MAG: hypothetical protein EOP61_20455 [Sphingomonadales bacterium]